MLGEELFISETRDAKVLKKKQVVKMWDGKRLFYNMLC